MFWNRFSDSLKDIIDHILKEDTNINYLRQSISNQIRKIDASPKKATIHTATSNSKIDDLKAMIKISTLR